MERPFRHARRLAVLATLAALTVALPLQEACADWKDTQKSFREAQKSADPKARRAGYSLLLDHDGVAAVDEALTALWKEENGSVQVGAVVALAQFRTPEACKAIAQAAASAKGLRKGLLQLALIDQKGSVGTDVVKQILATGEPQALLLAAAAAAKRELVDAVPRLVELLSHKDWQVRMGAARALTPLARVVPKEAQPKIVEALAAATGREKADLIELAKKVFKADAGDDVEGWRAIAEGKPAPAATPSGGHAAWIVGIPVYGRRVVLIVDHSLSTDDPQPFGDRERLQALCKVPGARDVPWFHIQTVGQFIGAHAKRLVADLPEGTQIALVTVGGPKLGLAQARLTPATPGSRAAITKEIEELKPANGLDAFGALTAALDAGGKDAAAWVSGPDEIVYIGCGQPWLAPEKDPLVVGESIGLKARLRGVTIHAIGVGNHPEPMMRRMAELSGGRYLSLTK